MSQNKLSKFTSGKNGTFRMDPQELHRVEDVRTAIVNETVSPDAPFPTRVSTNAMTNLEKAADIINDTTKMLDGAHSKLMGKAAEIGDGAKKVSGAIRDAHQKLADGLDRINKTADFTRLERHVELLERAAAAMTTLAELDKSGHLTKFASALK
jgi:hypothetical protein